MKKTFNVQTSRIEDAELVTCQIEEVKESRAGILETKLCGLNSASSCRNIRKIERETSILICALNLLFEGIVAVIQFVALILQCGTLRRLLRKLFIVW